ncbi:jg5348 [Pararge aegeria aegeria]|uniref:Jg5348 protein n=1 Tax=Pararge aegeria aegeria TaxID=348720 RepID=A0A8S4R9G0_9NEOP|nr:jg5348 [Pararge aegeria aegeria]
MPIHYYVYRDTRTCAYFDLSDDKRDPSGADPKRRCEALRTRPRYIDHVGMQILKVPRGSMVTDEPSSTANHRIQGIKLILGRAMPCTPCTIELELDNRRMQADGPPAADDLITWRYSEHNSLHRSLSDSEPSYEAHI